MYDEAEGENLEKCLESVDKGESLVYFVQFLIPQGQIIRVAVVGDG